MPAENGGNGKQLYEFGPFRVDPEKETLARGGEIVPLTPKTFQILLVLVRNHTEVVTKDNLMKQVWPDTFVEEANLSRNIFLLRKALGESPQDHQYILTVPGRGYRLAESVRIVPEQSVSLIAAQHSRIEVRAQETKPWEWIAGAAVLIAAIAGLAVWLSGRHQPVVAGKFTIVLGDFENSTADAVFDGTLRQGLSVQLDQSPFLSLVPEDRIRQTLALMGKSPDQQLTPDIGREVCQRTGSAVVLDGSIANLGSEYVLGLRAVNCRTGDLLAQEQETATSKEKTLAALDAAAVKVRKKLGESASTLEKFDTPLEEATTSSLEALQAYTLGRRMMVGRDQFREAVPFFQRAIQLDSNFAMAFAALGSTYQSLIEPKLMEENVRRAYDLRTHLSQPEKFYIDSTYYHYVTGDLDKAREVYELAAETYPRYSGTHLRLWLLYSELGEFEKALSEIREAIRLDPARTVDYVNLTGTYINLGCFEDARNIANELSVKHLDSPDLHVRIYVLNFLDGNPSGMRDQVTWASDRPGDEGGFLELESETAASYGRMKQSRDFSRRAIELAKRAQGKELPALFEAHQSLWESLVGNKADVRQHADVALRLSQGPDTTVETALALALSGETSRARILADSLEKRFPDATKVRFDFLPTLNAQIALDENDPLQAISLLQPAVRYELGVSFVTPTSAIYVRGEAYLAAHRWSEAADEFRKYTDHRGIAANHLYGSLAHLQLGRAYAGAGDTAKAKQCYEDFLNLWKDADPDVPLLKQAKAEYAKLR